MNIAHGSETSALKAEIVNLNRIIDELRGTMIMLNSERCAAIDELARINDPEIRHLRLEDGKLNLALAGPLVEHFSAVFVAMFRNGGAENYCEITLHERRAPYDTFALIVQRVGGKSPSQLQRDAEQERDKMKRTYDYQNEFGGRLCVENEKFREIIATARAAPDAVEAAMKAWDHRCGDICDEPPCSCMQAALTAANLKAIKTIEDAQAAPDAVEAMENAFWECYGNTSDSLKAALTAANINIGAERERAEKAEAERDAVLFANKDLKLHWDVLKAEYDKVIAERDRASAALRIHADEAEAHLAAAQTRAWTEGLERAATYHDRRAADCAVSREDFSRYAEDEEERKAWRLLKDREWSAP